MIRKLIPKQPSFHLTKRCQQVVTRTTLPYRMLPSHRSHRTHTKPPHASATHQTNTHRTYNWAASKAPSPQPKSTCDPRPPSNIDGTCQICPPMFKRTTPTQSAAHLAEKTKNTRHAERRQQHYKTGPPTSPGGRRTVVSAFDPKSIHPQPTSPAAQTATKPGSQPHLRAQLSTSGRLLRP